jgi:hypothetical protein
MCNDANYTKGSKRKVNTIFNSLVQRMPRTRFNTSEYSQSTDQIYSLLQFQEDATFNQLYNYSQQVTSSIRQGCGNDIGDSISQSKCFLHYENYSSIGKLDTYGWYTHHVGDISNHDIFTEAIENLVYNLSIEASYGFAIKRDVFSIVIDSLFQNIYT